MVKTKKGISGTVVGIILLVVGIAILVSLIIYFSSTGNLQISDFLNSLTLLKRGS